MEKKKKKTLLGILMFILIMGIADAGAVYYYLFAPQSHPQKTAYIYIDRDDTADSIYNKVKTQGNPRNFIGFKQVAQQRDYPHNIHTGHYIIHPDENTYRVFNRLYRGCQELLNLTMGSVRTLDKLARNVGKQLMTDSAEIIRTMNDSLFRHKLRYNEEAMAYLFISGTYQAYWDMSIGDFFKWMRKEHQRSWNQKRLDQAKVISMTPEGVCTLASIVEEETNNNPERPVVAGLYVNRLHAGMPLRTDPVVKFALQDFGLRRIINDHLTIDSPYNIYHNPGLSPGPIRIPSPVGLDAVLGHTKHNCIYMYAEEDFSGTHNFASNYAGHMKNARECWKALSEREIFS